MNLYCLRSIFCICLLFAFFKTRAQQIPINVSYTNELNSILSGTDSVRFTSVKPLFLETVLSTAANSSDTFLLQQFLTRPSTPASLADRLLNHNLLQVHKDQVNLSLNPVLTANIGRVNNLGKSTYTSTRGFNLQGKVGDKINFGSTFWENQARFPHYYDSVVRNNFSTIPGQGIGRNFRSQGYDFARAESYLSYRASPHFNAVLGYGKNFIGDGYRSLLLSDNSFSYPYLRLQAAFWKLNYTVYYNQYSNPRYTINDTYQRKFSTIHYLTYNVSKRFQVALFESIIWQGNDTTSTRGFDLQYLNPIIFLRPVEFSVGSADNALLGLNMKYQLTKKIYLYNQFILDDINIKETLRSGQQHLNNKYGVQLGLWTNDIFSAKGLNYRLEYNTVRPFTYGHRKINQNYTHYNQALAHPLGANFHEIINDLYYTHNRWYANLHSIFAVIGQDYNNRLFGSNLWGGEIDVPISGERTLDGLRTNFAFNQFTAGWTVNPAWNMKLQFQVAKRSRNNNLSKQSETFFNIGVVTALSNNYFDF